MSNMMTGDAFKGPGIQELSFDEIEYVGGAVAPAVYVGIWLAGRLAVKAAPHVVKAAAAVATYVAIDEAAHN